MADDQAQVLAFPCRGGSDCMHEWWLPEDVAAFKELGLTMTMYDLWAMAAAENTN
jgi:hypothetical protein